MDLRSRVRDARFALGTVARRMTSASDTRHWSSETAFTSAWDERSKLLSKRVETGNSVVDIGAGMQVLRDALPPGCTYTPVDVARRTPDTVVWDINSEDPFPEVWGDWVVISGVLEYVLDTDRFLDWVSATFPRCALSYVPAQGRYRTRRSRRARRWVNDLTAAQLDAALRAHRFEVAERVEWNEQILYWLRGRAAP